MLFRRCPCRCVQKATYKETFSEVHSEVCFSVGPHSFQVDFQTVWNQVNMCGYLVVLWQWCPNCLLFCFPNRSRQLTAVPGRRLSSMIRIPACRWTGDERRSTWESMISKQSRATCEDKLTSCVTGAWLTLPEKSDPSGLRSAKAFFEKIWTAMLVFDGRVAHLLGQRELRALWNKSLSPSLGEYFGCQSSDF